LIKYLDALLKVKNPNRGILQIIGWWEVRRILYNLIVLACGIISISIMSLLIKLNPGEDLEEPIVIIAFALFCNISYTLGWITEIFIKRSQVYGAKMFKLGLFSTIVLVFLPAFIHIILWFLRGFVRLT
jgi:hypothetical protein